MEDELMMISNTSKVLIIDDFETVRVIERKELTDLGFTKIEESADGEDAKKKLINAVETHEPFDLILCDWNMPHFNGMQLLEFCRDTQELKNTPFIMVTAEGNRNVVVQALTAGADDYIVKPFTKDLFLNKILKINQREQAE
jgi:two-component system chemotaxis response regulator CheY